MLFRNSYKNGIKNQQISGNLLTDFTALMDYLGISSDDLNISGANSLKEIVVLICIKILAEAVSKLPLKIYQNNNGIQKATNHYLYPFLKLRPNPYMSACDFWKCIEVNRNIYGNSYVWLDFVTVGRNAGKIQGFYPLNPLQMEVWCDDIGLLSSKNSIWYIYNDNMGIPHKLQSSDLLHFKGLTSNGLVGINPIETLRNSIENAKSAEKFLNNSYKNGMQTKGIVQYVGDLNKDAEETFRTKFEQMSNGLSNSNRVSLLPIGYQFQPISLTMTDAQFLENTELTERQLAAAFGIKMHQLNNMKKNSYASTSEANAEFYSDTLLSILTMYEQELTYKIFLNSEIQNGYYAKFNTDVILRANTKTRYEAYALAIQNGFKTPNEIREMEEDPAKDGGDGLLVNGNMIPVTMAGQQYAKGGK